MITGYLSSASRGELHSKPSIHKSNPSKVSLSLSLSKQPHPPPKMASQMIENHRENSEVYQGEKICQEKARELLDEISLPKGLLPLEDLVEVGYNRSTGFVWLKQKNSTKHRFTKIGKTVSYAPEVTAFVENRRMKRVTGVKSMEILMWVTLNQIYIDDPSSGKITFGTPTGISRSFPVSAFEGDDEKKSDAK